MAFSKDQKLNRCRKVGGGDSIVREALVLHGATSAGPSSIPGTICGSSLQE